MVSGVPHTSPGVWMLGKGEGGQVGAGPRSLSSEMVYGWRGLGGCRHGQLDRVSNETIDSWHSQDGGEMGEPSLCPGLEKQ